VRFAVVAKSVESLCWLQEKAGEDLDSGLGYGIEGISAVLWSVEGKPSSLEPIWRYTWEVGFQFTELGNLPASTDRESDGCSDLLFSETVLGIVCNNGDEGLGEFPTTIVKLSMRGSNSDSACVPPTITPLVPPSLRNTISTASTASRGGFVPRATLLESGKYAHAARGSTICSVRLY
jgi:hypothetical protein